MEDLGYNAGIDDPNQQFNIDMGSIPNDDLPPAPDEPVMEVDPNQEIPEDTMEEDDEYDVDALDAALIGGEKGDNGEVIDDQEEDEIADDDPMVGTSIQTYLDDLERNRSENEPYEQEELRLSLLANRRRKH